MFNNSIQKTNAKENKKRFQAFFLKKEEKCCYNGQSNFKKACKEVAVK